MKKIVCLAIYTMLTASLAAAEKPREEGTEVIARGDFAGYSIPVILVGYDTTGRVGIGAIQNNALGELCWSFINLDEVGCIQGISMSLGVDSDYANQPFTFTDDIPFYGKLWGKGLVTLATPVHYVIPIDKETADIAEIETKPYGFGANVVFQPYILDRIDGPSIGYATEIIIGELPSPLNRKGATVLVEYLEGNVLSGELSVEHRFEPGALLDFKPSIRWGDYIDPSTHAPSLVTLGNTIPEGPIMVSFAFDGYTTDTVTLNIMKNKVHYWNNAAVPIDGLSPNASSYFGNSYRIGFDNDFPDGIMINDAGHQLLQNDEQSRSVAAPSDGIRREF